MLNVSTRFTELPVLAPYCLCLQFFKIESLFTKMVLYPYNYLYLTFQSSSYVRYASISFYRIVQSFLIVVAFLTSSMRRSKPKIAIRQMLTIYFTMKGLRYYLWASAYESSKCSRQSLNISVFFSFLEKLRSKLNKAYFDYFWLKF